jgi:hypothetical protein
MTISYVDINQSLEIKLMDCFINRSQAEVNDEESQICVQVMLEQAVTIKDSHSLQLEATKNNPLIEFWMGEI